ncbi:hypothetical protein KFL_003570140 [Klebsormidium nitens]|uniref:EGF-like domain-containing protein n=1 Tax=Klebsormidium nitens TaxID=105231 RepID=A0A1Y1I948_KLENI|nr:hypothetical protein KFL_003570140 [Klebsormidium nitens]|eukprot:GAQ87505.1 hypothetical protein KFL_003570140 [Klebsormidium nitens]
MTCRALSEPDAASRWLSRGRPRVLVSADANGTSALCNPPCLNGGVGALIANGTCTCTCPAPDINAVGSSFYTGLQCETPAVLCDSTGYYCANGGQCPATWQPGGACTCPDPFYGPQCQFVGVQCGTVSCQNGGRCGADVNNQPTCVCLAGYTGSDCSEFNVTSYFSAVRSNYNGTGPMYRRHRHHTHWYYIFIGVVGGCALCCVLFVATCLILRRRAAARVPKSMKRESLANQDTAVQMSPHHFAPANGV